MVRSNLVVNIDIQDGSRAHVKFYNKPTSRWVMLDFKLACKQGIFLYDSKMWTKKQNFNFLPHYSEIYVSLQERGNWSLQDNSATLWHTDATLDSRCCC